MRDYAISLGVPAADIVLDFAGRRTYDTCYRASAHLRRRRSRAGHPTLSPAARPDTVQQPGCRESEGVIRRPPHLPAQLARLLAVARAGGRTVTLWEVWVSRPLPVLGQPEPIFPIKRCSAYYSVHLNARLATTLQRTLFGFLEAVWIVPGTRDRSGLCQKPEPDQSYAGGGSRHALLCRETGPGCGEPGA
jgi:hypothetical protein